VRTPTAGLWLTVLLATAAACSDDDSSTSSASPTTAAPSPTVPAAAAAPATSEAPDTTGASPSTSPTDPTSAAAKPSAGCSRSRSGAPGERTHAFHAAGSDGRYIEHLPPSYDGSTPLPLVLDLHGYSEPIEFHTQVSSLGALGDTKGFITVTPAITRGIPRWDSALGSDDLVFLGGLLDRIGTRRCVDENRIYATGFSNGAFMTSALACEFADRIAAVAPIAGVQDPEGCDPDRPVPLVAFHGTDDEFVSFEGGLGPAASELPTEGGGTIGTAVDAVELPSVPEVITAWADRNGCADRSSEAIGDDVRHVVHQCPAGTAVELYRVEGGGHAWPGSEGSEAIESVIGRTTFTIDASEIMWEFFENHSLPG